MPIVSIVTTIDQSASMSVQQKFSSAQTDTCTFINIMQPNDKLGVVGFSDNSRIVYPPTSSVIPITGQPMQDVVCQAVNALTTLDMTNIKAAITQSQGMLANAAAPRGIVLLSDGFFNAGGDPTQGLATNIPIYTVALGNTFNPSFMQYIATQTGGTYNYSPDAFQLAEIYGDIAAQSQVAAVVVNTNMQTRQNFFSTTPVQISAATANAYYAVSWQDPTIQFTPGTPTGKQLTVRLINPAGQPSGLVPQALGAGFVVFKLPQPTPGLWQVEIWNSVPGGVQTTVGVYEPGSSLNMQLEMAQTDFRVGKPITYSVKVIDGDTPADKLRLSVWLERPVRSLEQTLDLFKRDLESVVPSEALQADGVPESLARFAVLTKTASPEMGDLHPRCIEPLAMPASNGRAYEGKIANAPVVGEYTLRIFASGNSRGVDFRRQRRISFVVSNS